MLNALRSTRGVDTYGGGRLPWLTEPAVIIILTDGPMSVLTDAGETVETVRLADDSSAAGPTRDRFRWDQRIFAVCLRIAGVMAAPNATASPPVRSAVLPVPRPRSWLPAKSVLHMEPKQGSLNKDDAEVAMLPPLAIPMTAAGAAAGSGDAMSGSPSTGATVAERPNLPALVVPHSVSLAAPTPGVDTPCIASLCEDTGGRWYVAASVRQAHQSIDHIAGRIWTSVDNDRATGVVCSFAPLPAELETMPIDADGAPVNERRRELYTLPLPRRQVFVRCGYQGLWPLPEPYPCDHVARTEPAQLPLRSAHPLIHVSCVERESPLRADAAFPWPDFYELEPCPLSQYILTHGRRRGLVWYTYALGSVSSRGGRCATAVPFGLLREHPSKDAVQLAVLPLDFPRLLQMVDAASVLPGRPDRETEAAAIRRRFDEYTQFLPGYYLDVCRARCVCCVRER